MITLDFHIHRIHEIIRATDSRNMDPDRHGIYAAYFVRMIIKPVGTLRALHLHSSVSHCSYTKASLVASIIFVLDKKTDLISAPHALVYLGIVIFLVYFKLSSILLGIHDPFVPFENLFCALFMGGVWDSLAKILGRGQNKDETKEVKTK